MQSVRRVEPQPSGLNKLASLIGSIHQPAHTRLRRWTALGLAISVDAIQIALFPLFSEGILSPIEAATDVAVAVVMTWLLGWHFAFLPGFVLEQIPFVDLAPTWTIATLIALRERRDPAPTAA